MPKGEAGARRSSHGWPFPLLTSTPDRELGLLTYGTAEEAVNRAIGTVESEVSLHRREMRGSLLATVVPSTRRGRGEGPGTFLVQFLPDVFWTRLSLVVWVYLPHVSTIGKPVAGAVGISAERSFPERMTGRREPYVDRKEQLRVSWSSNEPYRDRINHKIKIRYGTPKNTETASWRPYDVYCFKHDDIRTWWEALARVVSRVDHAPPLPPACHSPLVTRHPPPFTPQPAQSCSASIVASAPI